MGMEAANPLPTERVCPECGGKGSKSYISNKGALPAGIIENCPHGNCKDGIIQIYYSPEGYKEKTGEDYPDDCLVWVFGTEINDEGITEKYFQIFRYWQVKKLKEQIAYIVQTAQPAPEADYRREE